jgi:hypothetical protein
MHFSDFVGWVNASLAEKFNQINYLDTFCKRMSFKMKELAVAMKVIVRSAPLRKLPTNAHYIHDRLRNTDDGADAQGGRSLASPPAFNDIYCLYYFVPNNHTGDLMHANEIQRSEGARPAKSAPRNRPQRPLPRRPSRSKVSQKLVRRQLHDARDEMRPSMREAPRIGLGPPGEEE